MEWLGEYSHEYEMFLTVADKSSFYEMAQQFIQRGFFERAYGSQQCFKKCPVVIFTSIDTYPIISLIPRQAPLSAIPIYIAFLTKVVKVTMMRLRRRYNAMLELKMRASQLKHPVDVVEEVIKKPGKAFVLITVLDVNVFREYKVAATNADARIVITLMEKEWLTKLKRLAESEENTTTPPKPPVTFLQIMAKSFLSTCGMIMIISFCNK